MAPRLIVLADMVLNQSIVTEFVVCIRDMDYEDGGGVGWGMWGVSILVSIMF